MFTRDERVLVAVSGGKDSLALWDVLLDEGYDATGLYLDLGIFDYSVESKAKCEAFAARRGAPLIITRVADEVGGPVPVIKQVTRRPPCSGCGLSKRYLMNRAALEHGMAVVATGHNLDDEAATLFGSVMHWQTDALPRQSPALASTHPKLVRRVKPLYRLSEREAAAYAFLRRIDYIVEECPFAKGATSIAHKAILGVLVLLVERPLPRLARRDVAVLALQSFAGIFAFNVLLLEGLRFTSAAEGGIVTSTTPAVAAALAVVALGERWSRPRTLGVALAVAGILALNTAGGLGARGPWPLLGNLLVFGAVVGEAVFVVCSRVASH